MFELLDRSHGLAVWLVLSSAACGGRIARDQAPSSVGAAGMSGLAEAGGEPSASGGGSSSGGAAGSPPASEPSCGDWIDDLESGSGRICAGSGRVGVWYAFNDQTGEQWPALTTPGVPIPTSEIPGGRGASRRALHTYGQGFAQWGAGVGLDFAFDGATYRAYDASAFDGIRFWARSDTPQKLRVRVGTRPTTLAAYGGSCALEPCGPRWLEFELGAIWVELRLPFNDLPQNNNRTTDADFLRNELTNLQFMPQVQPFDFWIDDVRFYRDRSCSAHPAAGCEGTIQFPDAALAERVRRSVGKPEGELRYEDVCSVSPLARSGLTTPSKIQNLSGLECLVGLTALDLHSNELTDIAPLSHLTQLRTLELDDNQIRDVAPLSGLHALQNLSLRSNRLESPLALGDLPALTSLDLDDNRLSDVSPIAGLLSLSALSANRNQIVEVRALEALPALSSLYVESNPIRDLSQFLEFTQLKNVDLAGSAESCTEEEARVVEALLGRGIGVIHGSVASPCVLP